MSKLIEIPNGGSIQLESIKAIRLGDARPEAHLKPHVVVDYVVGTTGRSIVVYCETLDARNKLAADLQAQVKLK